MNLTNNIYLGFDTSNYTTSAAAVSDELCRNERRILKVEEGKRGLRQSDALFQHIKSMPDIYAELCKKTEVRNAGAVGVSTRPRSVEGSYMPVFLAGAMQAEAVSQTLDIPCLKFSHQDGHIMAGVYSSGLELDGRAFLSVHLSGGTTEILRTVYNGYNFDCEIAGATRDISVGQAIDRIGVAAGLKFPCGAEMDRISRGENKKIKLPVTVNEGFFNFSGLETKAVQLLPEYGLSVIAASSFEAAAEALERALIYFVKKTGIDRILIAGGVASNSFIRERLKNISCAEVYFASAELSSDNAVGIALCAKKAMERK